MIGLKLYEIIVIYIVRGGAWLLIYRAINFALLDRMASVNWYVLSQPLVLNYFEG